MEYILIGVVSAFNLIVIKMKLERKRYEDGFFDLALMMVLAYMFSGSYGGTVVAMVASFAISLYLFISPPRFTSNWVKTLQKEVSNIQKINKLGPLPKKSPQPQKYDL